MSADAAPDAAPNTAAAGRHLAEESGSLRGGRFSRRRPRSVSDSGDNDVDNANNNGAEETIKRSAAASSHARHRAAPHAAMAASSASSTPAAMAHRASAASASSDGVARSPSALLLRWTSPWLAPPTGLILRSGSGGRGQRGSRGIGNLQARRRWRRREEALASPPSPSTARAGSGAVGGSPSSPSLVRPTPMLTVLLLRLEERLVPYCKALTHPTWHDAAKAARIMDAAPRSSFGTGANDTFGSSGVHTPSSAPSSPAASSGGGGNDETDGGSSSGGGSVHSAPGGMSPGTSPSTTPVLEKWRKKFIVLPPGGGGVGGLDSVASSPPRPPWHMGLVSRGGGASSFLSSPGPSYSAAAVSAPSSYLDPTEWDRHASPFLLLAGAEAMYGSLSHLVGESFDGGGGGSGVGGIGKGRGSSPLADTAGRRSSSSPVGDASTSTAAIAASATTDASEIRRRAKRLSAAYRRIGDDFAIVGEILCDPILGDQHESSLGGEKEEGDAAAGVDDDGPTSFFRRRGNDAVREAATSLALTLSSLRAFVDGRRALVGVHADLLAPSPPPPPSRGSIRRDGIDRDDSANNDDKEDNDENDGGRLLSWLALSKRCDALLVSLPPSPMASAKETKNGDDRIGGAVDERNGASGESAADTMILSLRDEIKATSAALATAHYLEQCRFFETTVHAKKLKVHLSPSSDFYSSSPLPIQLWLRIILKDMVSIMAVCFDRIRAFSFSVHHFNCDVIGVEEHKRANSEDSSAPNSANTKSKNEPGNYDRHAQTVHADAASHQGKLNVMEDKILPGQKGEGVDYNQTVIDFIHKQESKNGPPIAIAVVFNANVGSLPDFERGFIYQREAPEKNVDVKVSFDDQVTGALDRVDGLRSWPAIYLRTTMRSGSTRPSGDSSPASPLGVTSNTRRRTSGVNLKQTIMNLTGDSDTHINTERVDGNQNRSTLHAHPPRRPSSSPASKTRNTRKLNSRHKLEDEYIKVHRSSWPLSEWPTLVSILLDDSRNCLLKHAVEEDGFFENVQDGAYTYREHSREHSHQQPTRGGSGSSILNLSGLDIAEQQPSSARSVFDSFVSLIDGGAQEPVTASSTASAISKKHSRGDFRTTVRKSFNPGSDAGTSSSQLDSHPNTPSAYHIARINSNMWITIIVRGCEEEKWHRRKTRGLSDEEMRTFLNGIAKALSLDRVLGESTVLSARAASQQLGVVTAPSANSTDFWSGCKWQDDGKDRLLQGVKSMMGLRPSSPLLQPLKSPYLGRSMASSAGAGAGKVQNRKHVDRSRSMSSDSVSAVDDVETGALAFFLGPELSRHL